MFLQCYISKYAARFMRRMWGLQNVDSKSAKENHVTTGYYPQLKAFTSSTGGATFQRFNNKREVKLHY
jgi:hypothetical protein